MTTFPDGYGTQRLTFEEMVVKHAPNMHPTFATLFFWYLWEKQGLLGVGGGWRKRQPIKPGFAPPGKSFHQTQSFASGVDGYCAVDLVVGTTGKHRAPTWAECADAPQFGLHTFIKRPPEPWHIQPLNIRGWSTWSLNGRPDPGTVDGQPDQITPDGPIWNQPLPEEDNMPPTCIYHDTVIQGVFAMIGGRWVPWLFDVPDGVPVFEGDHVWTREQVLLHQGQTAARLWRDRAEPSVTP